MRGPPRATWTNGVITGILFPHACPARCGARRRCGTAKSASAPCLPLSAGTLLRHSSPRQAAHTPQRLIAHDDTPPPIQQSRACLSASASRRPLSPHQFRHSAPDLRGSVQPPTMPECLKDTDVSAAKRQVLAQAETGYPDWHQWSIATGAQSGTAIGSHGRPRSQSHSVSSPLGLSHSRFLLSSRRCIRT